MKPPPTAYFVGRKRPLTELTPDQRRKIRDAYRNTGFAHNESEEGICIVFEEEQAINLCAGRPGWFYYKLPIYVPLPEDTADFYGSHFPASDVEMIPLPWKVIDLSRDPRDLVEEVVGISNVNYFKSR